MELLVWVAGLVEEIIGMYGDSQGSKDVEGMDAVADEDTEEEEEGGEDSQDGNTGSHGGSHQGMAKAADVLASSKGLKQRHFMAKRLNQGNCVLCYHTKKGGEFVELTYGKVHLVKPFVAAWLGAGMEHWKITASLQHTCHMCNVPKDQLDNLQADFKMKSSQTLMKKVLAAAFGGNLDSNSEESDASGEDNQDNHQWIGKTLENIGKLPEWIIST
eukprot:1946481-Rhodomonas_salina.1